MPKKSNYTIYYIIISIVIILIIGIIIYFVYYKGNKGNKGNNGNKGNKKRVVYAGYWLDNSNIPTIVENLKNANITHILLPFIIHPDNTKPLTGTGSMLDAFKALSADNQNLLKSNFTIGASLGGALKVQDPFSNTFAPGSYYYNNPEQYAQDYYDLVSPVGLNNYFDLDIEHISPGSEQSDIVKQTVDFIGEVCKKLKDLNPNCEISHAPQPPYFTPQYGNIYTQIYQKYNDYFDFFNIQYYNNGISNNFEQIFIKSDQNVAPETSVLELINKGIDPSYLVVGKTVKGESDSSNGYIDLNDMINIIKQAFQTDSLKDWCATGGEMIWRYDTQNLNTQNNTDLLNYFTTISNF